MKKALSLLMVFGAFVASADSYLYWMVDTSKTSEFTYDTVKVAYVDKVGDAPTFMNLYYNDGTAIGGTSVDLSTVQGYSNAGIGFYASLASDPSSFSYAIELFNGDTFVAKSDSWGVWSSYQAVQDYIASSAMAAPTAPWTPSSYAVPEPNSALLMLIGCAMLGLKRKKQRA